MKNTRESASSALSELTPPDFGDRTLVVWARVLLVGGGAILRGALPVHLPEFQVLAIEGLPTNARAFLRAAAPDVVLVGFPLDADARLLLNEICVGGRAPLVALATSAADAASLALLEQEFAEVIVLDDGDLPADLSKRLLAAVRAHRAAQAGAPAPASALDGACAAGSEITGQRRLQPPQAPDDLPRATGEIEQRLAASLRSLEDAHRQLQERAVALERIVAAGHALRSATTREQLAQGALDVLAGLPGFGLVAVGLQDDARGATEIMGVARLPSGVAIPLGRRTIMLDLLELAPERRRVSQSHVVEGCSIRIHGSPDTWGPRTARGEWDLSELFDGLAVAVTPLRAGARSHGFLFVKAPGPGMTFDAESLRAVEILAHLVGASFDTLRLQDAERRRTELNARVNRLSRALMEMHEPEQVLRASCAVLASVLEDATVTHHQAQGRAHDAWLPRSVQITKAGEDDPPFALGVPQVSSQLVVPVRTAERGRAWITATSPVASAFDDLDPGALELLAEIVGKALANAEAMVEERRSLLRLQLVSDIGRIASSSLETDEVLARALAHLCQQGDYEHASVALVDRERRKLVITAQASRAGGRPVHGISTRLEEGITGAVAATGEPELVPDVSRDPRYVPADDAVRSELCVPLRVADDVVGVLNLESRRLAAFDEQDLVAMAAVGDHLAAALANSRLFRQVRDKNRQLRESERNKSEFLAIVAHDLRTPLTSIRSAADVLLMYGDEPPEVKQEFLEGIRDEAARLGRLVDDFLTYSRMEEGVIEYDVQELDLSEVILHFLRVFEGPAAQRRIELTCNLPASLPPVLGDRERISQVLANLMSNATRYVPEGGHVRVGASVLPGPVGAMIGTVQVDVTDDGPGIEECHRERIFDKFVRLDGASGGGAGLGLPIARAIVEHLGGRLWLDPDHRGGARFILTLPARVGLGM